jgi:hypothetical protein
MTLKGISESNINPNYENLYLSECNKYHQYCHNTREHMACLLLVTPGNFAERSACTGLMLDACRQVASVMKLNVSVNYFHSLINLNQICQIMRNRQCDTLLSKASTLYMFAA